MTKEMPNFNPEGQQEIANLLQQLYETADQIGEQLLETDFIKIDHEGVLKAQARIEIILSAIAMAIGLSATFVATGEFRNEILNPEDLAARFGALAVAGGGAALFFKALQKLEQGYKKLKGFVQIKELKDAGKK